MSTRAREVVHREAIDNETLIRLVRQRPCLYDKADHHYNDQLKRDTAWLEICRGSFENWDIMTSNERSEKLSLIQIRWKGLRDCFKRYLRKISEARSGLGSKRLVAYVHADELDFLRPYMELGETQSSWEVGEEGHEAPLEPQGSQDQYAMDELPAQELNPSETSVNTPVTAVPSRVESPGPTQVRRLRNSRPPGRHLQNMDRFADLVDRLNQKLDDLESEEHGFGIMVAGMLKKIPQERRNQAKKAVMDLLESSVRNEQPNCSSPMFGPPPPPPPSGPYYSYSNPPPPRTHPYYSPRFRPYSDKYGNMLPSSHPRPRLPPPLVHRAFKQHHLKALPPAMQTPIRSTNPLTSNYKII